jgi:hypothetical protein
VAVLATLSATRSDSLLADGDAKASAMTGGYHLSFLVGAGLTVVAIVVAVTVLSPRSNRWKPPSWAGRIGLSGRNTRFADRIGDTHHVVYI